MGHVQKSKPARETACLLHPFVVCLLFATLYLTIFSSDSLSDGIYVTQDRRHALGEHTTIKLTTSQILDVERKREVTLTNEQLKPLRKIYKRTPRKIMVVSSRWDTCTCDMGLYAIWCRPGEIDVPHSAIENQKTEDDYFREHPKEKAEEEGEQTRGMDADYAGETVILDSKGRMFIKGRMKTEKELFGVIDRLARKKVQHKSIYLDIPPPINDEIDNSIRQLVDRLEAYSKKKGIGVWAMGLSYEKELKQDR